MLADTLEYSLPKRARMEPPGLHVPHMPHMSQSPPGRGQSLYETCGEVLEVLGSQDYLVSLRIIDTIIHHILHIHTNDAYTPASQVGSQDLQDYWDEEGKGEDREDREDIYAEEFTMSNETTVVCSPASDVAFIFDRTPLSR
jgi:hypothetical protein